MDRETFINLIPAYALDALDADEKQAFELMLAGDAEAQRLLAEYQALGDLLVLTTPARPAPVHLKADLRKRLADGRGPAQEKVVPLTRPNIKRSQPIMRLVALAAMLALVVALAWYFSRSQSGLSPAHQLYNTLIAEQGILRKDIVPSEGQDQLAGELVASSDGIQAVIRVSSLPQLEANKTFQLWFIGAESIESGGLFQADRNNDATYILVPLEDGIENYQAFAVSIEPEGGSPDPNAPTTPPIFAVPMTT